MLPNLIIIGASKCATTSLHWYLATHPEVFMTRQKELHFFIDDAAWGTWHRGLPWYEEQFEAGQKYPIRGESSPGYTHEDNSKRAAELMAQTVPGARLIYLMRDPVERIKSHYGEEMFWGRIPTSVSLNAIIASANILNSPAQRYFRMLVYTSLYHRQLFHYVQRFALNQLLCITTEALRREPNEVMKSIFSFLRIDTQWKVPTLGIKYNQVEGKRLRFINPTAVLRAIPGYNRLSSLTPAWVKGIYRQAVSRKIDYSALTEISERNMDFIMKLITADVEKLSRLLGRSFEEWSYPEGKV
ncbi:MAG: sulfotransferase [Candidatus Omnitrophota bacterium]|nr:sulfotransferase [Candidatus Omnitrophota bacterium]